MSISFVNRDPAPDEPLPVTEDEADHIGERHGRRTLTMAGTVRDATFDVFRRFGMTTIFANPGSTEIAFLTGLPDDLRFVLALHEGSVVGIATGYATVTGRPALVNLHTTAGLGNAVGALATARVNRVPLVVIVGQQDRRHLALPAVPRRATWPGWPATTRCGSTSPPAPRTCRAPSPGPGTRRTTARGPALVIVPSDDWAAPADDAAIAAPAVLRRGHRACRRRRRSTS